MGDISGKKIKQKMNVNMSHICTKKKKITLTFHNIFTFLFFFRGIYIKKKHIFLHLADINIPLEILHVSPIAIQCCQCLALSPESWGMVLKFRGRYSKTWLQRTYL